MIVIVSFCDSDRPFRAVQRFLHTKPLARQLGLPAYILTKAAQLVLLQYVYHLISYSAIVWDFANNCIVTTEALRLIDKRYKDSSQTTYSGCFHVNTSLSVKYGADVESRNSVG